jgi:ketol-acid reductoisomerase
MTADNVLYDAQVDRSYITGRNVAVLGYGSQGHAHALNLRDSGVQVTVGLPLGSSSREKARQAGLRVYTPEAAAFEADVIVFLTPDPAQPRVFQEAVAPNLAPGDALIFSHGFNIRYGWIVPPSNVDVGLIAPKGPGHLVRTAYENGAGVPCLVGVEQDYTGGATKLVQAYAAAIGAGRAGIFPTTFTIETETDLFGEQVPLCGGLISLVFTSFEVLTEEGYPAEAAYFECIHELKLIVDLIYEHGVSGMLHSISTTAKWGALTVGPTLFGDDFKERLRAVVLANIRNGSFAEEWRQENEGGLVNLRRLLDEVAQHPAELIGAGLRDHMPFLPRNRSLASVAGGSVS